MCMYPAPISSLPELHELHESISCGAGSPEASPVSSSLSMGTIPRDDHSALVSSDSDPEPPLNPTVDSDPDDDCCVTCWDHNGGGRGVLSEYAGGYFRMYVTDVPI